MYIYKTSVPTSQTTQAVFIRKDNGFMLFTYTTVAHRGESTYKYTLWAHGKVS